VLDGVTVEAGEQAASRNLYAGRLTLDSLVERVGHSHFERLREVDLSGMGLKELGDVFTKEEGHFTGIQMLTLDNNELTEVSMFWSHPDSYLQNGLGRIAKDMALLITRRGQIAAVAEIVSQTVMLASIQSSPCMISEIFFAVRVRRCKRACCSVHLCRYLTEVSNQFVCFADLRLLIFHKLGSAQHGQQ